MVLSFVFAMVLAFFLFYSIKNSRRKSLDEKFQILALALNDIVFGGDGYTEVISRLEFSIRDKVSSNVVHFKYRCGYVHFSLNLSIRGEQVRIARKFLNKPDITTYDQLILEKDILIEISKIRRKVISGFSESNAYIELAMN